MEVVPGTGLCPSQRGSQNWGDPAHTSCVAPGKRPRLTPNPALAILADGSVMPFGSPGGDVQAQAMVQAFLNRVVFGMDLQQAVEAPRFATQSFPDSFEPHDYVPGAINVESPIPRAVREGLARRGHQLSEWRDFIWRAGAVCLLHADRTRGVISGAADPPPSLCGGW
jgi:gamma-glutamyltranspeptidase/glutathione hydrolase